MNLYNRLVLILIFGLFLPGLAVLPAQTATSNPLQWQELRSGHFRFIYQERDISFVTQLQAVSEEVYTTVSALWRYAPPELIPVIVRGEQDAGAIGPSSRRMLRVMAIG